MVGKKIVRKFPRNHYGELMDFSYMQGGLVLLEVNKDGSFSCAQKLFGSWSITELDSDWNDGNWEVFSVRKNKKNYYWERNQNLLEEYKDNESDFCKKYHEKQDKKAS